MWRVGALVDRIASRFGRSLALVVAAGAVLRVVRLIRKWDRPLLLNDSLYYSMQARDLSFGRWFREPFSVHPGADHGPVTSALMALVSRFEPFIAWQRTVPTLFGIATVGLVGLIGRRVGGPAVGIVAAAIAAVYPNIWLSDALVMSESISLFLVCGVLLGALAWRDHPSRRFAIGWGLLLGVAALARSELLVLAVLLVVAVAWTGRRAGDRDLPIRVLLVAVSMSAALAPWMAWNAVRFDRPVLLTTNEGGLWAGSYCYDTFYGDDVGGWSIGCLGAVGDSVSDFAALDPSERSHLFRDAGVDFAKDNVRRLPVVVAVRGARLMSLAQWDSLIAQDVGEEREKWAVVVGMPMFWALCLLAIRGSRRVDAATLRILLAPVVVVALTALAFYGTHRLRSSAEPSLVLLAAVALVDISRGRRADVSSDGENRPATV